MFIATSTVRILILIMEKKNWCPDNLEMGYEGETG